MRYSLHYSLRYTDPFFVNIGNTQLKLENTAQLSSPYAVVKSRRVSLSCTLGNVDGSIVNVTVALQQRFRWTDFEYQ
jgi:hypothetical protein